MSNKTINRLKALLETERSALLSGDLAMVAALLEEKTALSNELTSADQGALRDMSNALSRNGVLLAAARDGVEDVVQTLSRQRAARTILSTYDKTGKPKEISGNPKRTERRF